LSLGLPETSDFHPLGLELFHQRLHSTLFVANAGRNQSSIEIFHVSHSKTPKLTWKRSITHPLIPNANAILAVSPTQLYITNDHRSRRVESKAKHAFETYSLLPTSFTTFLDLSDDTVTAEIAVSFQRVANGIAATPDLETVFIAESGGAGFGVYTRHSDNTLSFQEHVTMNGHADNIHFVEDGYIDKDNWGKSHLLVGLHPNVFRMMDTAANKRNAPSWIVSARPTLNEPSTDPTDKGLYKAKNYLPTWHIQTELQDDGEWFGSSCGAVTDSEKDVMVGSGLYDSHGAFICQKL
jgi:hypothetical protein